MESRPSIKSKGDLGEKVVKKYFEAKGYQVIELGDNIDYRKIGIDLKLTHPDQPETTLTVEVKSSFNAFEKYKPEGRSEFWFVWENVFNNGKKRILGTIFRSQATFFIWCTEKSLYIFETKKLVEKIHTLGTNTHIRGIRFASDHNGNKETIHLKVNEQHLCEDYKEVSHSEDLLGFINNSLGGRNGKPENVQIHTGV